MVKLKFFLKNIYEQYNKQEFVYHDPLIFLYDYPDKNDREIVALISSSLAYGRVAQILKSVESVLKPLGQNPHRFIMEADNSFFKEEYTCFKHRFTCGVDVAALLISIKKALKEYGNLENLFYSGLRKSDILESQHNFTNYLNSGNRSYLLPTPKKGSACKRLNLFLRWMVRRDEVDPGGWDKISPELLIIPLDTHMLKVSQELKLTSRKQGDLKTALEITEAFRKINRSDPVKYDFALTRPGILGIK
jgi:uncharacterized protein (TIGR02757 family)